MTSGETQRAHGQADHHHPGAGFIGAETASYLVGTGATAHLVSRPPLPLSSGLSRHIAQRITNLRHTHVSTHFDQEVHTLTAQPLRGASTITPQSARRAVSTPACQRIVEGPSSRDSSRLTADFYQAIIELTVYGSTPAGQELSLIAADQFGIHADPVTAAQLHAQAVRAMDEETARARLDELDRLKRRPRGLFYDGHRDRITLWDSTEDEKIHLHTCTGPELRRCAAAAVEYGDLTTPPVRHQTIDDRYLPTSPDDPALILAQAAAQLGRQAAAVIHHLIRGNGDEPRQQLPPDSASPSTGQLRHVPAAVGVVPVAGAGEELSVGHLEESYTRHVPGPRSRASALVREHKRRRAEAGPEEAPTITVRSHLRLSTGPAEPRPSITRVRGH